jgi:hypothetical protein
MSAFADTLRSLVNNIQKNSVAFGIDTSDERLKSQGYALALSTITDTPWETAYSPEQGKYLVYPRDVAAARLWAQQQDQKKSMVAVQWWPMVGPIVLKKTIPLGLGIFAAGFILSRVMK